MRNFFCLIFISLLLINLTGCYTIVGVAEEENIYEYNSTNDSENRKYAGSKAATAGYFEEDSYEDFSENSGSASNDVIMEDRSVNFFSAFTEALSGFISSGALNVIFDLTSSSNNSSSNNKKERKTRNNSGSRNYSGRDR